MITRQVIPILPDGCQVCGFLYESDSRHELGQDMLDVVLPNGILITAGWYPEGDPSGAYQVSVYRGYDEIVLPLESTTMDAAATDVERRARQFVDRNYQIVSDSATSHGERDLRAMA